VTLEIKTARQVLEEMRREIVATEDRTKGGRLVMSVAYSEPDDPYGNPDDVKKWIDGWMARLDPKAPENEADIVDKYVRIALEIEEDQIDRTLERNPSDPYYRGRQDVIRSIKRSLLHTGILKLENEE
jgi:hypothetical protein